MQKTCKFNFYNTQRAKEEGKRIGGKRTPTSYFGSSLSTQTRYKRKLSTRIRCIARGKYGGGIKVLDGYRLDRKYLNPAQQHLLKRLAKTLSGQDRDIMESILRDFALKNEDGM